MGWTARVALALIVTLAAVLAGCGGDDENHDNHDNREPESTAEPSPATLSPVIVSLQQEYEALRSSQQAIGDVWEKLAVNEEVSCGSYPDALSPETISAEGETAYQPLADLLRQAAIDIDHAINTWKAECANPRRFPPPDVIDEGRRAARSAGDALHEAETLLAGLQ